MPRYEFTPINGRMAGARIHMVKLVVDSSPFISSVILILYSLFMFGSSANSFREFHSKWAFQAYNVEDEAIEKKKNAVTHRRR